MRHTHVCRDLWRSLECSYQLEVARVPPYQRPGPSATAAACGWHPKHKRLEGVVVRPLGTLLSNPEVGFNAPIRHRSCYSFRASPRHMECSTQGSTDRSQFMASMSTCMGALALLCIPSSLDRPDQPGSVSLCPQSSTSCATFCCCRLSPDNSAVQPTALNLDLRSSCVDGQLDDAASAVSGGLVEPNAPTGAFNDETRDRQSEACSAM